MQTPMRCTHTCNWPLEVRTSPIISLLRPNCFPVTLKKLPCSAENRENVCNALMPLTFLRRFFLFWPEKREISPFFAINRERQRRDAVDASPTHA